MGVRDLDEENLMNRDPNRLNSYVLVEFSRVFGEPDGNHSGNCVWRNGFKCFDCSKSLCYKIYSCLCALPLSILWGCFFACVSFNMIWCVTPTLRLYRIILFPIRKMFLIYLSACVAPIIEAHAYYLGRIHVTNSQGSSSNQKFR